MIHGSNHGRGKTFFSSPHHPDWLWDPPSLLLSVYWGSFSELRGGADKPLGRPTSRCRRTELVVSLVRGVCSCIELQVFSCCRGWKEACQATRAISTISRHELSSSFFFFSCKARCRRKFMPFWQTLGEYAPLYATIRNCVAQFKRGDFPTCDAPHHGQPKTVTTLEIIVRIQDVILEDRWILAKSIAEQLGISLERVGSIIHEDLDMQTLSAKWVPKCLNADQKRQWCQSFEQLLEFFWRDPTISCRNWWPSLWPGDKAIINGVAA